MDIIMLASARWDGPYSSSAYSLAKEFSKKNRVFYIDNPITVKYFLANYRTPTIRKRLKALLFGKERFTKLTSSGGELIAVTPGLILPVNFLSAGLVYDRLSAFNDWIVSKTLKQLLKVYHVTDFVFINSYNPFFLQRFPVFFKPKLFVYITVDDISQSLHVKKHGPRLEEELIRKAQLTLTTSTELKKLKSPFSLHVAQLPNAADVSLFKTSLDPALPKPKEMISLEGKPIIIYTGHIDSRIDYDLLTYLFQNNTDKYFLMVGPISTEPHLLEELKKFPNAIFTGKKDISELPGYLRYSQCAIIPFKRNVLTKSIYPLKINEYLAAGKPVVSTYFSEDINDFKEVIDIQDDYSLFSGEIEKFVKHDSEDKISQRIKFVENNTWEARVNLFWQVVDKYLHP